MSVLGEYSEKLYGRLLDNYAARKYYDQPVYIKETDGGFIPSSWLTDNLNSCQAATTYFVDWLYIDLSDEQKKQYGYDCYAAKSEANFFVYAAHVVYVPFGKAGYDYLKKVVAEKFGGKPVGEFLFEKFLERTVCPINGSVLAGLDDGQLDFIKDFFVNFQSRDEVTLALPKEAATLTCRLFFALDGLQKNNNFGGVTEKYFDPFERDFLSTYDYENNIVRTVKISDYERRIPVRGKLTEKEKYYIRKIFGLL